MNFSYVGMYIVGVFFFISGFGLGYSYLHKKDYLKGYFRRRVLPLFLKAIFVSIIYMVYKYLHNGVAFKEQLSNIRLMAPPILNGWFIGTILLFYVFFYISFKFFKKPLLSSFVFLILSIAYVYYASKTNYGIWVYNSCITMSIGLFAALLREKLSTIFIKYDKRILYISTILLFFGNNWVNKGLSLFSSDFVWGIGYNLLVVVGLIYILSLFRYMAFESKGLSFLGDISFEIYMIHGLFIELFSKYMTGSNLLLIGSSVCVFVLSILSAWVLNRIFSFISRKKHINV